jgi:dihydrofolate synthase/folylpolyglutamate synthase
VSPTSSLEPTPLAARLAAALGALYARVPLGMRLGLPPMREACARAGNPERSFECVHIAGTNGKGSVSALVESAARASGKRTGLYTSPHLARFAERIRIDGLPIDDERLVDVLERALVVGADLSFFETATLAAFLAFRDAGVSLAVLEVGLGGRLDATNVIERPLVCAVTRIALDHQDRLGNTCVEIAREKAAIAKPGAPLVVGPVDADVRAAIVDVAKACGTEVRDAYATALPGEIEVGLEGSYQRENARVAYAVLEAIGLAAFAARGFATARWPGRFERVGTPEGEFLFDAAHNPDGAKALVEAIRAARERPTSDPLSLRDRPLALVFGALADKDHRGSLGLLAPLSEARFYTEPKGRAPASPEELSRTAEGVACASLDDALAKARAAVGREGIVLVCGSVYLVGEARAKVLGAPLDPPVAL